MWADETLFSRMLSRKLDVVNAQKRKRRIREEKKVIPKNPSHPLTRSEGDISDWGWIMHPLLSSQINSGKHRNTGKI
jgi:hypothetical protein